MSIEEEIFKKSSSDKSKLEEYGFIKEENFFTYAKNILNDSFKVIVKITDDGKVNGKIYDLSFNEEYNNYRLDNIKGVFVNKIKEEFINVLNDINDKCFTKNYFSTDQANRITKKIFEIYGDVPEFLWKKFPNYGVFKNKSNHKWYGIIMDVNGNKFNIDSDNIEILNVKLESRLVSELLNEKHFYFAYHMNKNNWITIVLNDTLTDEKILKYISLSYNFTIN